MHYAIWFDHTVHLGSHEKTSSFLVEHRHGRAWQRAVDDLTFKVWARDHGKITNLEIHSHGDPGVIYVNMGGDKNNNIDHKAVAAFGAMLKPLMAPGGMIEVLCCKVAIVALACIQEGESQYSQTVRDAYFGALEQNNPWRIDGDKTVPLSEGALEAYFRKIRSMRDTRLSIEGNGLEFCLTLARTSGAIVRAATRMQVEFDAGEIMTAFDTFGNWEGPVFDFSPSGEVKFLGVNLERHNRRFPAHPVGPSLTHNFREQSANSAEVGQRPQRRDRSPLPV